MTLEEFLSARLDEEESSRDPDLWLLREVAARREILALWGDANRNRYDLPPGVVDGRDPDERERDAAVADMLDVVLGILAAVYRDHPDYDPAWSA